MIPWGGFRFSSCSSSGAGPEAFLARHWQRPLAANGPAPGHFSPAESSLDPAACGSCHLRQFEDWRTSLHSRAMGPGLMGQLQAMGAGAREEHQACLHCHAPLAEQADHLVRTLTAKATLPPGTEAVSAAQGLTCAGCHVRGQVRLGPPRADGSVPEPGRVLPHAGWQVEKAFADARFCAACHQFEPDWPSLNGKPLDANKTYKVAGWAPVTEAARDKGGEPIWDLVARHLRNEKVVKVTAPNVPKLKGVAGNPGMV